MLTFTRQPCRKKDMTSKQNITQAQMGIFLGVSQQYVNLLIKNKVVPRMDKLKRFSKKTGTDLSFWLDSTGPEKEFAIKQALTDQTQEVA